MCVHVCYFGDNIPRDLPGVSMTKIKHVNYQTKKIAYNLLSHANEFQMLSYLNLISIGIFENVESTFDLRRISRTSEGGPPIVAKILTTTEYCPCGGPRVGFAHAFKIVVYRVWVANTLSLPEVFLA